MTNIYGTKSHNKGPVYWSWSFVLFLVCFFHQPPSMDHEARLCREAVCLLSALSRLFRDEVVIYKGVTLRSGQEPWHWFITPEQVDLYISTSQSMKWGGFRNVYLQTEHESQCNWLAVNSGNVLGVCDCSESLVLGRSSFHAHSVLLILTYLNVHKFLTGIFPATFIPHLSDSPIRVKVMVYIITTKLQP